MRSAPGKPRFVECAVCGVMLDLGTIEMGYKAFCRQSMLHHVPRDVTLFESEDENTESEDEADNDDGAESESDAEEADEEREGDDSFDDEEKDFSEEED